MKKFIVLFSILILCVYFAATSYKSGTEKSAEVQHLITEEDENRSPTHSFISSSDAEVQEEFLNSTSIDHNDTIVDPVNQQVKVLTEEPALVNLNKNISTATIVNDESLSKRPVKELDFYVNANAGMVYHNNSQTFVEGIKKIGERVLTLVESSYGPMVKNIVALEIKGIQDFKGKVDFHWLNSASLGYYAGENGKVDFEIMYSKVTIKDENPSKMFDETAGIFAFLLNLYYNPEIQNTKFSPYIGFGIGPTVFRLKKINSPSQDLMPLNVPWFAYQVKLGVDYSIIPEVKTFLGYRYFSIPIPVADDISTHNVELGLLFNF